MYESIKDVIEKGNYELVDMLEKINTVWLKSYITKEEMEELETLAREKANIDNSIDILNKLKEIDVKMQNFETRLTKLENPEEEEPTEPTEEYPAYVPGKWYYNGDNCSENGKNYTCIAPEGQVCVWSPSEYPTYWEEVVENTGETVAEEE